MPEIQETLRKEIIEKLIAYIKEKLSPQKAKFLIPLAPLYFRTIPLDDFSSRSTEDLVGMLDAYLKLMSQRGPKEPKIDIYNPHVESHGWQSTHTVIDFCYDDMAFLRDSMNMELNRLGFTIHLVVSCGGVKVKRDAKGKLLEILTKEEDAKDQATNTEAIIHIEIDRETDEKILATLRENLLRIVQDVTVVVEDWSKMRDRLSIAIDELEQLKQKNTPIDKKEIEESQTFLRWLVNDRFTFLGYREYEVIKHEGKLALKLISNTGLGVLRDESKSKVIRYFDDLPPKAYERVLSPKDVLIISQTNTRSSVHRPSPTTNYIGIKMFDEKGQLIGEHRFIGLYTSEAYSSDPQSIPVLREKVEKVLVKSGLPRSGHNARALRNILATLPRDDLFQADIDELYALSMGILNLQDRRRTKLFVRKDAYGRYFSCLVFVPRENFNTELLYKMRDILLEAFNGRDSTFSTQFSESILARIHFVIYVDAKKPVSYDIKNIEHKLIEVGRQWYDDLRDHLIEHFGEEKGNELVHRYLRAFPAGYRENFSPREAIYDIEHIEKLKSAEDLGMSFYHPISGQMHNLRFKLYHLDSTIPLSDALPMLENMGLRVIGEQPYKIAFQDGSIVWINDFNTEYRLGEETVFEQNKELFQEDFYRIWRGDVENDGFNRLVLKAQLNWRQATVFRAYAKYLRQTGFTFSQQYIEETLVANPNVVKVLFELFELRFNPEKQTENTPENQDAVVKKIYKELDSVLNLDQDRILRRFRDVILATLRTNFYIKNEDICTSRLAFKFDPTRIPELPLPLPMFEIFVYSPRFEGIHLRAGKVARGGIRWSDRREDFRTEVLGLMKAQQVKNAIIVPAGAKGGFVAKCLPVDGTREAILEEGIACYKGFISGLLDITDNLVGKEVVHPKDTVIYDGNDPYLVVAADKGTASFSDIANGISAEYNFWLGDAFASGGSTGYDHKKMGITSRGAWESVQHHFQRILLDINQPFSVVGIGDMSGDVFGNGMLLSDNIKLIAAFNDKFIFLDPSPDPKKSFQERRRLFNLPRSNWSDYNPELISAGGGVFSRAAKSIKLSQAIRTVLDFQQNSAEPNELIRAILKAPVDLIWNGGIGTYVKSAHERNFEVGDRSNDALRINGNELRCRVVGEGGNLGWTQLGRIEYALTEHGNINTDFIDNSAGVDCSDHEVNIKILLNEVLREGDMTEKQRNTLLASMTEEIAGLVLNDNYRQVRTITREVSQSLAYLSLYINYMSDQEKNGKINRQLEFLPDTNTLMERKAAGKALTRPEIAVLMEYSKILLKEEILKSNLIHDPYMDKYVGTAFPAILHEKFKKEMLKHRLRPEIVATQLSNAVVNDMGPVFVYQMQDEMSAPIPAIVQAYIIMEAVFDISWLFKAIDKLDDETTPSKKEAMRTLEMTLEAVRLTRRAVRWLLRNQRPPYDIQALIERFAKPVTTLYQQLPNLLIGVERDNFDKRIKTLIAADVPSEIAVRVTSARYIYSALNIIQVVTEFKENIDEVAKIYFILADRLDLVWFREQINAYPVDTHWVVLARSAFKDELDEQQRALVVSVLKHKDKGMSVEESIDVWIKEHDVLLQRWQAVLTQMRSASVIDASILTVAIQELSELAHNSIH